MEIVQIILFFSQKFSLAKQERKKKIIMIIQKIQLNPEIGFIILLSTLRTLCMAYHAWGNSVSNNFSFFPWKIRALVSPRG